MVEIIDGISATIYEAHATRLGGRCYSNRKFPGQVAENGGEMIDNQHKVMLAYANEFNLLREDLVKSPGEPAYHFFGQSYSDAEVVDEIRVLVKRMKPDLQSLSSAPDFYSHSAADVALDDTVRGALDELSAQVRGLPSTDAITDKLRFLRRCSTLSQALLDVTRALGLGATTQIDVT